MAVEIKPKDDGTFTILTDGKETANVKSDEIAQALTVAKASIEDREITVRVGGVDRRVRVSEAAKAFEKVDGADEAMRESADGRKALSIMGKMQATPTEVTADEFDFLLLKAGVPTNQRATALDAFERMRSGDTGGAETNESDGGAGKPLTLAALPPEVQLAVQRTQQLDSAERQRAAGELRNQIEKDMKGVLTSDKTLSIILAGEANGSPIDWQRSDSWASALFSDAMDKVRSRVLLGNQPSPELYNAVAQELRQRLLQVGKLVRSEQATPGAALGPALGLSSTLQAHEPVKRVPVTDPKHSQNFKDRLMGLFVTASKTTGK